MPWNIFDVVGAALEILDLLAGSSASNLKIEKAEKNKKSGYIVELISFIFIIITSVLLLFTFKDPLPTDNNYKTLIVISLIGIGISLILFFILYQLGLYYFKSLFKLLLFSCSTIALSISTIVCIYFKSGIFL